MDNIERLKAAGVPNPEIAVKIVETALEGVEARIKAGEATAVKLGREEIVALVHEIVKAQNFAPVVTSPIVTPNVKDWARDAIAWQLGQNKNAEVWKRYPSVLPDGGSKIGPRATKAWDISGTTTGGSWCPDEYVPEFIANAFKASDWMNLVSRVNMGRRTQTRPTITNSITVGFEDYAGAGSSNYHKSAATDPTTSSKVLTAVWVYVLCEVPNDLIQDMEPSIMDALTQIVYNSIANKMETWGLTGATTTDPWDGILTVATGTAVSVGNKPTWADYVNIKHSIRPPYMKGAVLVMNQDAARIWEGATDLNQRPLFREATDDAPAGRIGSIPIVLSENITSGASSCSMFYGNPGGQFGWVQGYRSTLSLLVDPYSNKGENATDFLWEFRTDGMLKVTESHSVITQQF